MGDRVRDAVRDGIGGGHRRRHDVLNQAAASAVPVVTLPRHGTGAERALDVLVGDGVALILGVTGGLASSAAR